MSIRKTSEYRNAMKAHKACYSEVMTGPKLSSRLYAITEYHRSLETLVSRMLKDECVPVHEFNTDTDSVAGMTYYDLDFSSARSVVAGMARNSGMKIPSFRFKGGITVSVDMTPDDVLCEVRMSLRERDDEVELAKDLIVSTVANKKTLQAER